MSGVNNDSETGVAILALGHLGISLEINLLSTERSAEASACRRYFNIARNIILRDFPYSFSRKFATLSLVESDPNSEWSYSYRYPSDCIYFKKILSGVRNDVHSTRVPYIIASDSTGKLIYTDSSPAECEYTRLITDIKLYPDDVLVAFSLLLASLIAPRVTSGDGVKLGDRSYQLYMNMKTQSNNDSRNEEQEEEEPESEFIRARQ